MCWKNQPWAAFWIFRVQSIGATAPAFSQLWRLTLPPLKSQMSACTHTSIIDTKVDAKICVIIGVCRGSTKSDDKNWLTDGQLLSHICAFTIALLCLSVSQSHISSTSRMSLCAPTFCCYVNLIIAVSSATTWSISRYKYNYHKINIESFQVHQRLRKLHNEFLCKTKIRYIAVVYRLLWKLDTQISFDVIVHVCTD